MDSRVSMRRRARPDDVADRIDLSEERGNCRGRGNESVLTCRENGVDLIHDMQ